MRTYILIYFHAFMLSFIYSFIHTLIHSFSHSFNNSFVRTYIHPYINSFLISFIRTYILYSCFHSFSHSFIQYDEHHAAHHSHSRLEHRDHPPALLQHHLHHLYTQLNQPYSGTTEFNCHCLYELVSSSMNQFVRHLVVCHSVSQSRRLYFYNQLGSTLLRNYRM